jgi:hypothetical protein
LNRKVLLFLLLLTFAALLIHGYHPWAEDAEIYLPGVEKLLHPQLFPFNAQFFEPHAHATLFRNLIAASVRLCHLPLESVLFVYQLASIFLFLLACWQLSERCFPQQPGRKASDIARERWAGVLLVATLLTLPIAGTALYIMDQYTNPRNLVAFAALFSIVRTLDGKYFQAILFLIFAALIHPLMAAFAFSACVLLIALKYGVRSPVFSILLPFGLTFAPPPKAYHYVAVSHSYHYLTRWQWYEWLGVIGPLVILYWFSRVARSRKFGTIDLLSRMLIIYELIYILAALVLDIPPRFEALARLQPMRCLYLLYIIMLLIGGGFLADFVLKNRVWRWLALFLPLGAGMFVAQRLLFPANQHIEWPGTAPKNEWAQAFLWIRNNTPNDAIFALNPSFMDFDGEDEQGFRALARRSRMADLVKDAGAVSMFPALADEWWRQVQALADWRQFQLQDFKRLQADYGVNWVVLQQPGVPGLNCPYRNDAVLVCQVN